MKFLRKKSDGEIFPWSPILAERLDMEVIDPFDPAPIVVLEEAPGVILSGNKETLGQSFEEVIKSTPSVEDKKPKRDKGK